MATEYRDPASIDGSEPNGNAVDPTGIEDRAPEPAGRVRKPRSDAGKPRGPRTASTKSKATSPLDLSGLAGVIVGLTETIAQWRNVPEFGIDETEAKDLMVATQNVMRHYSVETTQKGADFIALAGCASMIVGTRVAAYNMRVRAEADTQERRASAPNVVRMSQGPRPSQGSSNMPHVEVPNSSDDSGGF